MSRIGMIVALAIAAALGVAFFVLQRRTPPPEPGPILTFDPAQVVQIHVNPPAGDAPPQTARRADVQGNWFIRLAPPSTPDQPAIERPEWRASPTQVRAALRIFSTMTPTRGAEEGPADATTLTIELDDGSLLQARVGVRPLAGQVIAESVPAPGQPARRGWISAEIAEMLASGLGSWRDPGVLYELGPETSRITLEGAAGRVALARVQGRWALREPVAEAADASAVSTLVSKLANLKITDFLDHGAPTQTGLDQPRASLTIEADLRSPTDPTQGTTTRTTLRLGQAVDVAGRNLAASVERSSTGFGGVMTTQPVETRTVVIDASPLGELSTDPAAYIAKRAIPSPSSDIGAIVVGAAPPAAARTLRRTLDGWNEETEGLDAVRQRPANDPALLQLLTLLCDTDASQVTMSAQPGSGIEIQLQTAARTPLGAVRVEYRPGDKPELAVHRGPVTRTYPAGAFTDLTRELFARGEPK